MNAAQALLHQVQRSSAYVMLLPDLQDAICEELERADTTSSVPAQARDLTVSVLRASSLRVPSRVDVLTAVLVDVERHLTDDGDVDAALAVLRGALATRGV